MERSGVLRGNPRRVKCDGRRPQRGLGSAPEVWQVDGMSTVTITVPDPLEATLAERVKTSGAASMAEYLLRLVEIDCVSGELDGVLSSRLDGPFAPLETDWKERVRSVAAKRVGA